MPLAREIIDRVLGTKDGEAAYKVVELLTDAGFEAWWVGGVVRDMLLGTVPKEIDIATSALPRDVAKLFKKSDESAAALGSIAVSQSGCTFEVTTFRQDDEASDGRHPESVSFTTDRALDARRRDFTVSAMYFQPISGELFDPFEGERDLKERLVRFIGDPATRIAHDALRMLRAVRLRATIDGQYEPATYGALQKNAELVDVLSGQRKLEELEKVLLCPHPDTALRDLFDLKLLERYLPELTRCKGIAQPKDYHHEGDVWEHMMLTCTSFTDDHSLDVRIAALFHDCGKAQTFSIKERIRFDHHAEVSAKLTKEALSRLQMPAAQREKICWLITHHMMMGTFFEITDERKAHWYFHPWFLELLQLFALDIAGTDPADFSLYDRIVDDYDAFLDAHPKPQKPFLSGDEIMTLLGLAPGERVGEMLKALSDAQVQKKVTSKKEATEFLRKLSAQKSS